ncbi:hypothetical protein BDY17DRAFT_291704 [Neohortaea acidophila]|uniref:DUF3074 domain-containing protein n=1 Tax=Neohortaea acidophila TaxID=245834 RepID=A0A6A6Q4I7_9PEZI|nr:uncharacterized protein BDY17DRAFT_291704 [Neohortaea acidophila]KAF2486563.1 hypothetical protein BDY17DRAFT_291704 [Neohortaea acidophila]
MPSLGPLIRMRALAIDDLPHHPSLSHSENQTGTAIEPFIAAALSEATTFMQTYLPQNFRVKAASKSSPPSTAGVKLLECSVVPSELPAEVRGSSSETWFARVSVHSNEAKSGTASWEEFDSGLRKNHSQHEMEYTPDVYDAHEVLNWDAQLDAVQRRVGEWEEVHVAVMEMAHKIPMPLNNRVFPELVITARKGEREFIVVQIPVSTNDLPEAKYRNDSSVVTGMYCSVELGEVIDEGKQVRWSMATASDAGGSLPMWMQKMGIAAAVVKDVGLFVDWCGKTRKSGSQVRCMCCRA